MDVRMKDPAATLDYTVNWAPWLNGDTIATTPTPAWTVPAGLTLSRQTNTTTAATAWLAGGTVGTDYTVTCRIVTTAGRTDERSFRIRIRDQ